MSGRASAATGGGGTNRFVIIVAATAALGGLLLIVASTVLTLINTITPTGMFWLYGFFGILFVYRIVPETKGWTLEEIDAELKRRVGRRTMA